MAMATAVSSVTQDKAMRRLGCSIRFLVFAPGATA
jgi:hypothetical protein